MAGTKKKRTTLESFFKAGEIPLEENFADLIASGINKMDDGFDKSNTEPLKIQAAQGNADEEVLRLYTDLNGASSWVISQNPLIGGGANRRRGLNIADGAGNSRLFIDEASGDVGIGTLSPRAKLNVEGHTLVTGTDSQLWFPDNAVREFIRFGSWERYSIGVQSYTQYFRTGQSFAWYKGGNHHDAKFNPGGGGTLQMVIDDGKLGIGTASPAAMLHISNIASAQLIIEADTDNVGETDHPSLLLKQDGAQVTGELGYFGGKNDLRLINHYGGASIFLRDNGHVGIGTDTPTSKLEVNGHQKITGGDSQLWFPDNAVREFIRFGSWERYAIGVQSYTQYFRTGQSFAWYKGGNHHDAKFNPGDGGTLQMVIDDGKVGIGTASPAAMLHLSSAVSTQLIIEADTDNVGETDHPSLLLKQDGAQVTGELGYFEGKNDLRLINHYGGAAIVLKDNGHVGIGTTTPTKARLEVEGFSNPGNYLLRGYMDGNGTIRDHNQQWGNGSNASIWASNEIVGSAMRVHSDARIKNNFSAVSPGESLRFINQLRPVSYQLVDVAENGIGKKSGFIAQEVEKLNPDLVSHSRHFIPNIYCIAKQVDYDVEMKTLRLSLPHPHECEPGDTVKIITEKEKLELQVAEAPTPTALVLEGCREEVGMVFVYGKKVNDFLTLDYNGIFSRSIGAIQALYGEVQDLKQRLCCFEKQAQAEA